jgi:hypothetical protein
MSCTCNNARKNTGVTSCKSLFYALKGGIFVPTYKDDGTRNKIAAADTLNAAYVTALLNQTEDARWYSIPKIENGTINQAEPSYETPKSGTKYFIAEGVTSVTMELFEQELKYLDKLKDKNCGSWSIYPVDIYGTLLGDTDGTDIYPIKLAQGSLAAIPMFAEEKTSVPKLKVTFDFDQTVYSENLIIIAASEFIGVELLTISGLLDVTMTIPAATCQTVSVVINMTSDYGTFGIKNEITGVVVTDFVSSVTGATSKLRNVTDGSDVAITACTENPDGTYTLTYSAQTNADIITALCDKNGYDFTATNYTVLHT